MFVKAPLSESRQIIEDFLAIGVKYVWTIRMGQDAMFILDIKGISANMISFVHHQHGKAILSQLLRASNTGKSSANN